MEGRNGHLMYSCKVLGDRFAVHFSSRGSRISYILRFTMCGKDVEKLDPCAPLLGAENGTAAVENKTVVSGIIKHRITI